MQDAEPCQAIFWHAGCVLKPRVLAQPGVAPQSFGIVLCDLIEVFQGAGVPKIM
jgi:hypothetical protein